MDDLEAQSMSLDDDSTEASPSESKLPLIALLVGAGGLIIGAAGMYMGAQASNALKDFQAQLENKPDTTTERLESIEAVTGDLPTQLKSIEDRLGAIGSQQVALQRADRETRDQTQRAFENVSREVSANRTQLNETTAKLDEFVTQVKGGGVRSSASYSSASTSTAASSTASSSTGSGGEAATEAAAPTVPENVHLVEAGETLSSIAKNYGIGLGALMAANPGVDPRRMRIGQQILIPAH